MQPTIRPTTRDDGPAIAVVHREAFPGDEARLVAALIATGKDVVSLVADLDSEIVGHILFSPVTVDGTTAVGLGLAPLAVRPPWQRQGIGSALIRRGLAACREAGAGYVVVLGHPSYYPRFGFQVASRFGLGNEYGATEAFLVMELQPGCLAGPGGTVRYAVEFAMLGEG